jgi:hypothetical protein
MEKCTDPAFEKLIHAYELGMLSDDDRAKLEMHMMECESCFQRASKLEEAAQLLKDDVDVKAKIEDIVKKKGAVQPARNRFLKWLWPDRPRFVLSKPLTAILLLAIIALPVYKLAIEGNGDSGITQTLYLFPMRTDDPSVLRLKDGGDVEIKFVYDDAEPERSYTVSIASRDGKAIYSDDAFSGFSASGMGTIILPGSEFVPGHYLLTIIDTSGKPPENEVRYYFDAD